MEDIIKITELTYNNLFTNFNISIPKNSFISISGPNNCGKTTLIRILDRQIFLSNITFDGKPLSNYSLDEYYQYVKTIIPFEFNFTYETLEEEVLSYLNSKNKEDYNYLLKTLKISTLKNKNISTLPLKDKIKLQLVLSLLTNPQILLLDDINIFYSNKEFLDIITCLKYYQTKKDLTIIMTTSNLEYTLLTDYLYIICDGKIILEGVPLTILEKDNLVNKIGLKLPFMIDLSVKLRDYNLITDIELDMNRMVDELWK